MQRRSSAGVLILIDLEINATCRKRNAERNRKFLQDIEAAAIQEEPLSSEASSSFPKKGESYTVLIEANIMADEPRRVTLEDYSSTSVLQFFISIARPEVQAQNITYPHSLIQLIQNNLFHGLPNEDPCLLPLMVHFFFFSFLFETRKWGCVCYWQAHRIVKYFKLKWSDPSIEHRELVD